MNGEARISKELSSQNGSSRNGFGITSCGIESPFWKDQPPDGLSMPASSADMRRVAASGMVVTMQLLCRIDTVNAIFVDFRPKKG